MTIVREVLSWLKLALFALLCILGLYTVDEVLQIPGWLSSSLKFVTLLYLTTDYIIQHIDRIGTDDTD